MFKPFRQIAYVPANKSLDARMHTAFENLFSRIMGSIVRSMVILVALVSYVLITPLFIAELVIWPLIPFGWVIIPMLAIAGGGI